MSEKKSPSKHIPAVRITKSQFILNSAASSLIDNIFQHEWVNIRIGKLDDHIVKLSLQFVRNPNPHSLHAMKKNKANNMIICSRRIINMCFSPIANPSMKFLVTAEDPVTIMIDLRCGIPKGIYREKDYIAPQKRDIDESIQWSNIEIIEQSYAAVTVNKSRLSFNSFAELLVNNIFQYRCVEIVPLFSNQLTLHCTNDPTFRSVFIKKKDRCNGFFICSTFLVREYFPMISKGDDNFTYPVKRIDAKTIMIDLDNPLDTR